MTEIDLPDKVLLDAVRAGDGAAYEALVHRHTDSALRVAVAHGAGPVESIELVAEVFARLFIALRQGGGPRVWCQPHLAAVIRKLASRSRSHEFDAMRYGGPADLDNLVDIGFLRSVVPDVGSDEIAVRRWDIQLVTVAFRALPARWREVLWALDVDGATVAEMARRMGISSNAMSSLAIRAREGLRRAYLRAQLPEARDPRCQGMRDRLAVCVRGDMPARRVKLLVAHLEACEPCRDAVRGLFETNSDLILDNSLTRWLPRLWATLEFRHQG